MMTSTTDNHAVTRVHKWQGIASSIIAGAFVVYIQLLLGIAMSGTQPSGDGKTALLALSTAMLCANLIGIALGIFGARDRSSRKLYPVLGLSLNVAIFMTLLGLALFTLLVEPAR